MANTRITVQELNAFRHKTRTGKNGETIYHAPLEINNREDLLNYGIDWGDCRTIDFGGTDRRVVYFYETDNRALAEEQWKLLNREHTEKVNKVRCIVPGKRKNLIRCPLYNSCRRCPYGIKPEEKSLNTISLEQLKEDGWDMAESDNPVEEICVRRILMAEMQEALGDRMMWILKMRLLYGYTTAEIAAETGYPQWQVYYLLVAAKKLAREWLAV